MTGARRKKVAAKARPTKRRASRTPAKPSPVEEYFATLDHPLKPSMSALRDLILGLHPRIREEIKWSAPSFALDDHFATFNLRSGVLMLVLHRGAKAAPPPRRPAIADPYRLLDWRGTDRAIMSFTDPKALAARIESIRTILTQWLESLRESP